MPTTPQTERILVTMDYPPDFLPSGDERIDIPGLNEAIQEGNVFLASQLTELIKSGIVKMVMRPYFMSFYVDYTHEHGRKFLAEYFDMDPQKLLERAQGMTNTRDATS